MRHGKLGLALAALALLGGCAGTPAPSYFTLDTGMPARPAAGLTPSLAITRIALPELIDRPQLVVRSADNEVRIHESLRWAEPLRRQIPLLLADEIGRQLGSGRVVAAPLDGAGGDADFRLRLDVQRLVARSGGGAEVDMLWHLESRQGKTASGRSMVSEAADGSDPAALVAAQRRALIRVAAEIAGGVRALQAGKP